MIIQLLQWFAVDIFKTILCMDDDRRTVMCDQKSHYILGKESTVKVVHLGVMAGGAI